MSSQNDCEKYSSYNVLSLTMCCVDMLSKMKKITYCDDRSLNYEFGVTPGYTPLLKDGLQALFECNFTLKYIILIFKYFLGHYTYKLP